jgi:hypothetical protein
MNDAPEIDVLLKIIEHLKLETADELLSEIAWLVGTTDLAENGGLGLVVGRWSFGLFAAGHHAAAILVGILVTRPL